VQTADQQLNKKLPKATISVVHMTSQRSKVVILLSVIFFCYDYQNITIANSS